MTKLDFSSECKKDLKSQLELGMINQPTCVKASFLVDRDARFNEHMCVSDFVDMCLSLARAKR